MTDSPPNRAPGSAAAAKFPARPHPEPSPVTATWHGVTLIDEFAWLKDASWQAVMRDPSLLDPMIRQHLENENAYADAVLAATVPQQETLVAEMRGRIREDDTNVPAADGPFAYFSRYREGGQHPSICREPRGGGDCEILIDGDALAAGKAFFRLGATAHSPDHKLLAWSADETGAELFTVRVRDLASMTELPDIVPETAGAIVWVRDCAAFYYVRLDRQHRPSSVHRHRLGTDVHEDVEIYATHDGRFVSLSRLQSGRCAAISAHDHDTSEAWLIDLEDLSAEPVLVAPREPAMRYEVEHHPDFNGVPALIIHTNAGQAEDFKIAWTPLTATARTRWRDVVPHRPGVFILSFAVLRDWLIRLEREDSLPRIVVRRLADGEEHVIAFAEEAYSLGLDQGYEFETDTQRFSYSSMTTPSEVWDYDLATRARTLRKRQEIPSGHDPAAYVTRRILAPTSDGDAVPVSLLYRKTTPLDGTAAMLIYGYGAYGVSMPAAFNSNRLSLVDRGFVFAIAHVRGGTEKGWRWYREGKLAAKQNTFSDFIAATEHLVKCKFAAPQRVVAQGGSAGGLLIGAVANQRPDLYAALIAEVPFVDVLNTMLDDTLPLTPPEWVEWGNPIADAAAFATIRAYSPYDNVRAQEYPAMLVLAGLTDPRVTYWEPAKWVARLRRRKTNSNLVVLRINLDAGHAGAPGRFDRLKEVALGYAFAIAAVEGALPRT
ncbi:MAG TPA: S9 family peptidase [Xanthobacteraceae bacterium]|nr:S9 family peptidase [Xanthobacteraceae bacterium]